MLDIDGTSVLVGTSAANIEIEAGLVDSRDDEAGIIMEDDATRATPEIEVESRLDVCRCNGFNRVDGIVGLEAISSVEARRLPGAFALGFPSHSCG